MFVDLNMSSAAADSGFHTFVGKLVDYCCQHVSEADIRGYSLNVVEYYRVTLYCVRYNYTYIANIPGC